MHERMASCVFLAGEDIAVLARIGQVVANLSDVFLPLFSGEAFSECGKIFVPTLGKS